MPIVTARKHGGDDAYSWAVFLDGRPVVTGLSKREVPYHRRAIEHIAGLAPCGDWTCPRVPCVNARIERRRTPR